jgi:hypothetical protein
MPAPFAFERLESVARFGTVTEAELCRGALAEAGIESWLLDDGIAGVHAGLGFALGVGVAVRPAESEAARRLLAALDAGEARLPLLTLVPRE